MESIHKRQRLPNRFSSNLCWTANEPLQGWTRGYPAQKPPLASHLTQPKSQRSCQGLEGWASPRITPLRLYSTGLTGSLHSNYTCFPSATKHQLPAAFLGRFFQQPRSWLLRFPQVSAQMSPRFERLPWPH